MIQMTLDDNWQQGVILHGSPLLGTAHAMQGNGSTLFTELSMTHSQTLDSRRLGQLHVLAMLQPAPKFDLLHCLFRGVGAWGDPPLSHTQERRLVLPSLGIR